MNTVYDLIPELIYRYPSLTLSPLPRPLPPKTHSSVLQPGSTELMIVMELLSCSVADLVSNRFLLPD